MYQDTLVVKERRHEPLPVPERKRLDAQFWQAARQPIEVARPFQFGDPVEVDLSSLVGSNQMYTDAAYWFTSVYDKFIAVVLWLHGDRDPMWVVVPTNAVRHALGARLVDMPGWAKK